MAIGASAKLPTLKATVVSPAASGEKPIPSCSQIAKTRKKPCSPAANANCTVRPAVNAGIRNRRVRKSGATRVCCRRSSTSASAASKTMPEAKHEPPPGRPAEAAPLEQRVGDGDERRREQGRADQVGAPGRGLARLGNDADSGDEGDERDRDVDQEDRAPAPAEDVGLGEKAAEHESERGGEAEDRAVHPERLPALLAGEDRAEGGQDLRDHRRGGRTLDDPRRDQLPPGLGETGGEARGAEERDPDQEDALAPEHVAEAAGDDQGRREGEHVRGHDPLQLRAAGLEIALDRRQGDVHDRDVDHVHQHRTDHHDRSQPALRIRLGGQSCWECACPIDHPGPLCERPSLANDVC